MVPQDPSLLKHFSCSVVASQEFIHQLGMSIDFFSADGNNLVDLSLWAHKLNVGNLLCESFWVKFRGWFVLLFLCDSIVAQRWPESNCRTCIGWSRGAKSHRLAPTCAFSWLQKVLHSAWASIKGVESLMGRQLIKMSLDLVINLISHMCSIQKGHFSDSNSIDGSTSNTAGSLRSITCFFSCSVVFV